TTIAGDQTTLGSVSSLAFDVHGNLWATDVGIFLVSSAQVTQFSAQSIAPGGQLNIAPTTVIAGDSTLLTRPTGIHFDQSGDIWVTDIEQTLNLAGLLRFDALASGDSPPKSLLQGINSGLGVPQQFEFFH